MPTSDLISAKQDTFTCDEPLFKRIALNEQLISTSKETKGKLLNNYNNIAENKYCNPFTHAANQMLELVTFWCITILFVNLCF